MLKDNSKQYCWTIAPKSALKLPRLTNDSGNELAFAKTASILNEYFSSVVTHEPFPLPPLSISEKITMKDIDFTLFGVAKAIARFAITQPQVVTVFHPAFYSSPKL
ncbi:MAG: hypothetical protein O7D30_01125 [Rickettsia endosymbiont of Ixodes persulcatus]|nr:hypothetical protein [Rickettsia endosymbiont of Ixodes persulcatus]